MSEFQGQVAVVTGAASGIGLAISKKLLQEGAVVALFDINKESLDAEFAKYNGSVRIIPIDITDESAVSNAINELINLYGKIDMLVNCAGITGRTSDPGHNLS